MLTGFLLTLGGLVAIALGRAAAGIAHVLLLVVIAAFLAVGLNPLVEALIRRGLRRGAAIGVVVAGFVLVVTAFALAVVPPLVTQSFAFSHHLPEYVAGLARHRLVAELDARYQVIAKLQSYLANPALYQNVFGGLLGIGKALLSGAFSLLTVVVLTLYFLGSLHATTELGLRLTPASSRPRTRLLVDRILGQVGGYVAGQLTIATTAGVVTYLFAVAAGVPYALPLALTVGLLDVVPQVGATLGGVVLTVVGLFSSVGLGAACLVFVVVYQQVENYVIAPRVMRRSIDVPALVTIVAALVGGTLLGLAGALLAIPTAAAIRLVLADVVLPRQERR